MSRLHIVAFVSLLAASGCTAPSPESYIATSSASTRSASVEAVPVGRDSGGDACVFQRAGDGGAYVYCGTSEYPSGHIAAPVAGGAGELPQLIASGPWRASLNGRAACDAPRGAEVAGSPALAMRCTRLAGGWPHAAFATAVDGKIYLADGIGPALPAIERAVGVLTGRASPLSAGPVDASLTAKRAAEQALSSGDISQFDDLMRAAADANAHEDFTVAERAYRAALSLQEKKLGRDNPETALPAMSEALALSNLRRYADADALFARAAKLAASPQVKDATLKIRVEQYQGINQLNQGHYEQALQLLSDAERRYAPYLPQDVREGKRVDADNAKGLPVIESADNPANNQQIRVVLAFYAESIRYQAVALRHIGRIAEADQMNARALRVAEANAGAEPRLAARVFRTQGIINSEAGGDGSDSIAALGASVTHFSEGLPDSQPLAETDLLRAGQLAASGRLGAALAECRDAVRIMRLRQSGASETLLAPCLDAYADQIGTGSGSQSLLAEMFEAAQLGQGTITRQQIASAAAGLVEKARDPKVGDAIRARDAAELKLEALERRRDNAASAGKDQQTIADFDTKLAAARQEASDAASSLRAAAPNLGQLVQEVVTAPQVFAALRPGEAFAAIAFSRDGAYTLLLRDGTISLGRARLAPAAIGKLVDRVRATLNADKGEPPPFDTDAAHALYQALFGDLAAPLGGTKSLVVSPAGSLASIPFALLLTGPASPSAIGDAPFLIETMEVAHVPAAANFVSLRKTAGHSRATNPWFGFGDFHPATLAEAKLAFPAAKCGDSARLLAGLPPLPGAKAELEVVREVLGAGAGDERLGAAFTADAVLKTPLANYRVIHFATHGLLPSDLTCQPEPSIVASATPGDKRAGLLTASDLQGLQLDADAVILSACNSGGAGESLSSLARAFFFAGARAMLVTHWDADDVLTAFLMKAVMQALRAHPENGLSGALAKAQRDIIQQSREQHRKYVHPYYWAVVALIGEGSKASGGPGT